jgi:hypothetical protein
MVTALRPAGFAVDSGADESGADDSGADESGADDSGAVESGADDSGSDDSGSDDSDDADASVVVIDGAIELVAAAAGETAAGVGAAADAAALDGSATVLLPHAVSVSARQAAATSAARRPVRVDECDIWISLDGPLARCATTGHRWWTRSGCGGRSPAVIGPLSRAAGKHVPGHPGRVCGALRTTNGFDASPAGFVTALAVDTCGFVW